MESESMIITKVKNIFIMLLHAISKEDISIVDHYLDDELSEKFKNFIGNNRKNNEKQVFRQQNISNIKIVDNSNNSLTLDVVIRFITYRVNRKTNELVFGDKTTRKAQNVILKFKKNNVDLKALYNCPNCGAGLKINTTGICQYCNMALDERFSPYVLIYTNLEL